MPEMQDIFRLYGDDFLNGHSLPPHIHKAVRAIQDCRTASSSYPAGKIYRACVACVSGGSVF